MEDITQKARREIDDMEKMINLMFAEIQKSNPDFRITPEIHQHPTSEGHKYVLYLKAELRPATRL